MSDNFQGLGGLVPDRIPDWLTNLVKKSGRNPKDFKGLDDYFRHTEVLHLDQYDRRLFRDTRDESTELDKLSTARWLDDPSFYDLVQDVYLGLWKARPEPRKQGDMRPTHKINHATYDRSTLEREWEALRTYTQLDQWAAAMAAVSFGEKLKDLFDEMKDLKAAQEAARDADNQVAAALQGLKDNQGDADAAEEWLDQLAEALASQRAAGEQLDKELKGNGSQIRSAVREATKEAESEAKDLNDALDAFGSEPGQLQRLPAEERMELARRIVKSQKLREMALKIGRMVRLALGEQARKIVHGTDEVHDITMGNNISRLISSELTQLADEDLEILFLARYVRYQLLEYELRGTEKVAQGAIVAMIDSSGSMGGAREMWAKAVAIALLNIANRQKRDFYGIIFGSAHQQWETFFPKGKGSPEQVLDFAEFAFMGGTDFMTPIDRAVAVLREQFHAEGSQKGDLLLVTDGECAVDDDWLQNFFDQKKELAYRFYSCLIGFNSSLLETLSDQVWNITDLADHGQVQSAFGLI